MKTIHPKLDDEMCKQLEKIAKEKYGDAPLYVLTRMALQRFIEQETRTNP